MQFLKILFWCLLAFVAALFTYGNWDRIDIHLWSGLIATVNLPLLLLVTFLVGFLPSHLYHSVMRWRLRQRLAAAEQTLADARRVMMTPPPPLSAPPAAPLPEPDVPPLPGELS